MHSNDLARAIIAARNAALLSLDEQRIRGYYRKYNDREMPVDPEVFWRSVHKARTALRSLPMDARQASKRWLLAHGSESMDAGEVPL